MLSDNDNAGNDQSSYYESSDDNDKTKHKLTIHCVPSILAFHHAE